MKKITLLALVGLLSLSLNAQYCGPNLIRNSRLDTATATCADPGYSNIMYYDTSPVKDWWGLVDTATARISVTGTPDYFNPNCTNGGTKMPDYGNNNPTFACPANSGSILSAAGNWEYVQTELRAPLKAGVEYEIYVEFSTGVFGNVGVWFEMSKTNYSTFSVYTGSPQATSIPVTNSPIGCSSSSITYCAQGGETWMIFGPEIMSAQYTFDNVSLREVCAVNFEPTITSSGMPDCSGSCVALTADTLSLIGGIDTAITLSYLWSTGEATKTINVCPLGDTIYDVDITVTRGCQTITKKESIGFCGALVLDVSTTDNGVCNGASTTVSATATGGTPSYTYVWDNGLPATAGPHTVSPTTTTTYRVTVTDGLGDSFTDSTTVTVFSLPAVSAGISTTICVGASITLGASGASTYSWSPSAGLSNPSIYNPIVSPTTTTTYAVTGIDVNGCSNVDTVTITVNPLCGTVEGTVFYDVNTNCTIDALEDSLENVILKANPGGYYASTNDSGYYSFNLPYGNYTITQVLPKYHVEVCPVSGSYAVNLNVGNYQFTNINFGDTINFQADALINVSNAAARPGRPFNYWLKYANIGSESLDGTVSFVLDNQANFNSANPTPDNTNGDTLFWNYTSLLPGAKRNIRITMDVPVTVNAGAVLDACALIDVSNFTDIDLTNNNKCYEHVVVNSYDPNDKQVVPKGVGATGDISLTDDELSYTVRFQNTGTASAIDVVIVDTLSSKVSIESIENVMASHPFTWAVSGKGVLTFTFANIMLPDSTTDEPASHGLVQYTIKQKASNTIGTVIENTAEIFFDFNPAIVTNTTVNTIVVQATSLGEQQNLSGGVFIYPNPTKGIFTVELAVNGQHAVKMELFDLVGKHVGVLFSGNLNTGKHNIALAPKTQEQGIYFLSVQVGEERYLQKVVFY